MRITTLLLITLQRLGLARLLISLAAREASVLRLTGLARPLSRRMSELPNAVLRNEGVNVVRDSLG